MKKLFIGIILLTGTLLLQAQVRRTPVQRTPVQQRTTAQASQSAYKGSLGHYELRGPVQSCKEIGDSWEVIRTFDRNGVLSTIDGESVHTSPRTYEFSANGRILRFFPIPGVEHRYLKYEYDKMGRLVKTSDYDETYTKEVITYSYNAEGHQVKTSFVAYGPHGGEGTSNCKVLEKDSYGNWTKRSWGGSSIEKREITYYE